MENKFLILRADPLTAAVSEMTRLHALSFLESWSEKSFQEFADLPNCTGYFAYAHAETTEQERGEAIGFVLLQGDRSEVDILTFAVSPEYRRRGVGVALLGYAVAELRQFGVRKIFLEVDESNQAALSLYMQCGFQEIGRRKNYYGYGSRQAPKITSGDALTLALMIKDEPSC